MTFGIGLAILFAWDQASDPRLSRLAHSLSHPVYSRLVYFCWLTPAWMSCSLEVLNLQYYLLRTSRPQTHGSRWSIVNFTPARMSAMLSTRRCLLGSFTAAAWFTPASLTPARMSRYSKGVPAQSLDRLHTTGGFLSAYFAAIRTFCLPFLASHLFNPRFSVAISSHRCLSFVRLGRSQRQRVHLNISSLYLLHRLLFISSHNHWSILRRAPSARPALRHASSSLGCQAPQEEALC